MNRAMWFAIGWACAFYWVGIAAAYIAPAFNQSPDAMPGALIVQGTVILVTVGVIRLIRWFLR